MSVDSLERAIPPGQRILLDSSTLIAYLDGGEAVSAAARLIVDEFVRTGRNPSIVSMVTVMELLVKPARYSPKGYLHVHDFLRNFPNLRLQPVDFPVAQEAAGIRANDSLRTPDALIVATGLAAEAPLLVSNDQRWRTVRDTRLEVVILSDHAPL